MSPSDSNAMNAPHTESRLVDRKFDFGDHLANAARSLKRGERTRAALRVAACRLLDKSSPVDLTVAAICKKAQVAHGTFYIHFTDRHALLADLARDFIDFVQDRLKQAAQDNAGDAIRGSTAAYLDLFEQNPGLMRCLMSRLDSTPETREAFEVLNREWITTVIEAEERRLARAGREGAISRDELKRRGYALGGMIDQYLASLFLARDPNVQRISTDRQAVINTLSLIWKRGMMP